MMSSVTVPVTLEVDEPTARACMTMVEIFLANHPDYDMRVMQNQDGTDRYRLVRKDEPCDP